MTSPIPGPPREKLIVYVDGFNLYYGLHEKYGRSMLWLDLVALAQSFRPRQELVAVRYFTAPVLDDPRAQGRQAHYIAAMQAKYPRQLDVVQGRYQKKPVRCFTCQSVHDQYEEKETDVNIAVRLLTDAAQHNMSTALVVSGDSDLVPAIKGAVKIRPTLFVAAAFPPGRVSKHLRTLMPASFSISDRAVRANQLPAKFQIDGSTFRCPSKWC